MLTAGVGDRLNAVLRTDIAGVDSDFVNPRGNAFERAFVIKMNVGNNRNGNRFFDRRKGFDGFFVGNSQTHNFTARLFEFDRLAHVALDVFRRDIQHRLDTDFCAAADCKVTSLYGS